MKAEIVQAGSEGILHHAVEVLKAGGLIAFPTDTVYGVAALPWDVDAVTRLYVAKRRPKSLPIPLLLSDADRLSHVATLTPEFVSLIDRFWPGGLTLVLPKTNVVPDVVSPGPSVAVRVPDLALARDIIRQTGGVLAVTSANVSGQPSPVTAGEVESHLGKRIELIVDGGTCRGGVPSSLLDCTTSPPVLLRRGAISEETLRSVVGLITTS